MMNDEMKAHLKTLLIEHEGLEEFPYVDTVGKVTIGIGYNLTDRGLPLSWINNQFDDDVNYYHEQLSNDFEWYRVLDVNRQIALIDMCFMGYKKFKEFVNMIAALSDKDYNRASLAMLNSVWADQVKGRATQLAKIILSGELP